MKVFLAFLSCIIFTLTAAPQSSYQFEHYQESEGPGLSYINQFYEDETGLIWLCTQQGLVSFDGDRFKLLTTEFGDSTTLVFPEVKCAFRDSKKNIWIGTGQGLSKYDHASQTFVNRYFGPVKQQDYLNSTNAIMSITEGNGKLYFGNYANSFIEYSVSTNQFKIIPIFRYSHVDSIYNGYGCIWDMELLPDGQVCMATGNGLVLYQPKSGSITYLLPGIYLKKIKYLQNGELLISGNGKLGIFNLNSQHFTSWVKINESDFFGDFTRDEKGIYWVVSAFNGIRQFEQQHGAFIELNTELRINQLHGLLSKNCLTVMCDRNGIVWVGTDKGMCKMDPELNRFQPQYPSISDNFYLFSIVSGNSIYSFSNPPNARAIRYNINTQRIEKEWDMGSRYIQFPSYWKNQIIGCSQDGLVVFDTLTGKNQLIHIPADTKGWFKSGIILYSIVSNDGYLLVSCRSKGLAIVHPSGNKVDYLPESSFHGQLSYFTSNKHEIRFLSVNQGKYSLWTWQSSMKAPRMLCDQSTWENTLGPIAPSTCLLDSKGQYWCSRYDKLIYFPSGNVSKADMHWIETPENAWVDVKEGMDGFIYLTSGSGLVRIDPKNMQKQVFNMKQGMPVTNLYGTILPLKNGLYIGSNFIMLPTYSDLSPNTCEPKLIIRSIQVFGKELNTVGNPDALTDLNLSWQQNHFSIDFISLCLTNQSRCMYSYKLEGFDREWITGNTHLAQYTNLPGGDYELIIRCSNNDGVWSGFEKRLRIHISTPWFKTWWFYLILLALLILLISFIYQLRLKRIIELQRVRNKIASDLHDDVGSTLSSISMLSKFGLDAHESQWQTDVLSRIYNSSNRMMQNMSDIVWAVNPDNDEVEDILPKMGRFLEDHLTPANIAFTIDFDEALLHRKLSMENRRDLYLLFKEAVNNIAKYSQANQCQIAIKAQGRQLELTITDNGKGFDTQKMSFGNGLNTMRQRAENMKGKLFVSSSSKGTQIKLIF